MKIIHVVPLLTKGGGERVAVDLANHAAAGGHEVTILSAVEGDSALLPAKLNSRVLVRHIYPERKSRLGRYLFLLPWVIKNRHWLASQDVVHCHMTFGSFTGSMIQLVRALSRGRRPVVVETYHAVGVPIPSLHRWVHARLAEHHDAVALMALDSYWSAFLAKRPRLLSRIIPNGIDFAGLRARDSLESISYARKIGISADVEFIVGTVGRLAPERRPGIYIPIFAEIARALGPKVSFILAGDGPERGSVKALVREHGLEGRVHFTGIVHDPSLPMSLMDLYLTLNVGPFTGIAALEASFSGLPVIAIQLVESFEAKPDDWIWSSGDVKAIAARAIELLKDSEARQALARQQNDHVKSHHTAEVMARSYYELYEQARHFGPMTKKIPLWPAQN